MIEIDYTWDENLAIESAKTVYDYELKTSNKKFIGWFFIALTQFAIVGALKHNAFGLLFLSTFGLIYWYIFRWPVRKYFIKKTFLKSPLANSNIILTAKDDGIYKDDILQIPKESIKKIIDLKKGVVVYYDVNNIFLPNDAFKNSTDRDKFIKYKK